MNLFGLAGFSPLEILLRAAFGVLGVVVFAVGVLWVLGAGPFHPTPSPAARVQARVEKAVPKVQAQEAGAVSKVEAQARTAIDANQKRTEGHVAKIRAAQHAPAPAGAPAPVYRDFPDRQFYAGVCGQELYAGSPDCRGLGGEPEDRRPAAGARGLRPR